MFLKKILIIFIFVFANNALTYTQNLNNQDKLNLLKNTKIDTNVVNNLLKLTKKQIPVDPDKALKYLQVALQTAQYINYDKGIANCYYHFFEIYMNQGMYALAWNYIQKQKEIYEKNYDIIGLADCYNSIGSYYCLKSDYTKALYYLQTALNINEKIGHKYNLSRCYNNIGYVHSHQGNYIKAKEYYKKALKINIELNDKKGISIAYMSIGNIYNKTKEYDIGQKYFLKALETAKENNDDFIVSYCYNHIGNIYNKTSDFNKALHFLNKSLELKKKLNENNGISLIYSNISNIFSQKNNSEKAIYYAKKAFQISEKDSVKNTTNLYVLKSLSLAYETAENYKEALKFYKLHTELNDSIFNNEIKGKIAKMEMDYDVEKKEKEINLLNEKTKSQELIIGMEQIKKRNQLLYFVGILLLILTIAIFFYKNYKLKQNKIFSEQRLINKKEQLKAVIEAQEKERDRFARDVHDGLGQFFTALKYKINKLENDSKSDSTQKFEEIDELVDELYHEIRNISFNIMPQVIKIKGLIAAVEELIYKIEKNNKIFIELNVFNFNFRLPEYIEVAVYRIIQELLNNILKYSEATSINISFTKLENELNIMIEDNGKGFDTRTLSASDGHGWNNIKSRAELINCVVDIDSTFGKTAPQLILIYH